jgi:hypothetical protein
MALPQAIVFVAAYTPLFVIVVLALLTVFTRAFDTLPTAVVNQIFMNLVGCWAVVLVLLLLACFFCGAIRPTEAFANITTTPSLLDDIAAAEKDVCALITRADKFIGSDQGQPGVDDPSLVAAAQQKARDAVGAPITDCAAAGPTDLSGDALLQEADNRITRMEATLKGLTGPEFQSVYNKTVPCTESFSSGPSEADLRERLAAVRQTIQDQQSKLLKPIDDKQAAVQRHEVSDCEKRRGANTAMAKSLSPGS